ncbi:hypothetical protein [Streptomyces sp. NPDC091278]|uniref:hypothetical protein n=1 Tax=Streptomyces sp. NPDC091278 TaxID=3155301 RepID=UPI00344D6849
MAIQQRAERTRREILSAAGRVFDGLGYERVALARIAGEARFTTGALVFRFAARADLATEVRGCGEPGVPCVREGPTGPEGFEVEPRRSGLTLRVEPGRTLLDVVREAAPVRRRCSPGRPRTTTRSSARTRGSRGRRR